MGPQPSYFLVGFFCVFCPFLTSNESVSRVADLDPALYKCLVGIITVFCGSDNCNISRVGSRYGRSKPGAETLIYMLDLKMYINISELIWDFSYKVSILGNIFGMFVGF